MCNGRACQSQMLDTNEFASKLDNLLFKSLKQPLGVSCKSAPTHDFCVDGPSNCWVIRVSAPCLPPLQLLTRHQTSIVDGFEC